ARLRLRVSRPRPLGAAQVRAIPMRRVSRYELGAAVQTGAGRHVEPILATAVCVEGRVAVRADDAEVLEPVVGRGAVDVVKDQRHRSPVPDLTLATQLASPFLQSILIQ